MSFLRDQFVASRNDVSLIMIGTSTFFTFGSLLGSKAVNMYGRKKVTVLTALLGGAATIIGPNIPILNVYLIVSFVGSFISGMMFTAFGSLTLEQVPERRSTMMSLSSASQQLGYTFGAGLGVLVLSPYGYVGLGFTLGILGVIGSLIVAFFVIDSSS
jgi:MFS family permease